MSATLVIVLAFAAALLIGMPVAVALGQGDGQVFVGQAVEAIAAQAAFPGVVGQRQHLLDLRDGMVKGGVEAGDLGQAGPFAQQDVDGLQGEGLVQRRQGDVAAQVLQDAGVDAHRCEILAAAVDDAVDDGDQASVAQPGVHAPQDQVQGAAVGVLRVEPDGERRDAGLAEVRPFAADALDLAVPGRAARQRAGRGVEECELDARRAAVQHQDQGLPGRGSLADGGHRGVLR